MKLHAITIVGHDRPGIIAEATGHLASLGLNIDDSTMTLLRGHFAMTLIGDGDASREEIETALRPMTETLEVAVREVADDSAGAAEGSVGASWILTVHGGDKPGIVSSAVAVLAGAGGNITDLSTHLSGELYLLIAEVDLPASADVDALRASLRRVGEDLEVGVTLNPVEADEL